MREEEQRTFSNEKDGNSIKRDLREVHDGPWSVR